MQPFCLWANEIRYKYVYYRQKLGIYIYIYIRLSVYIKQGGGGGGGGGLSLWRLHGTRMSSVKKIFIVDATIIFQATAY